MIPNNDFIARPLHIMTDQPASLSTTQTAAVGQPAPAQPRVVDVVIDNSDNNDKTGPLQKVEAVEEEPYTIKCICNFSDDDGNTIYCETCDTWQHIDCFYPDNRDEAIREDFAHSCAECKPRPLNRQKAIERTLRLKNPGLGDVVEKKPATKRPPSKGQKKKPKPADLQINGHQAIEQGKQINSASQPPTAKKAKSSHRPSQSITSQPSKRSPSYSNSRSNPGHPPSPATTPPDLPDDFQIHHYSAGFCSLYSEQDVPNSSNNAFASLAIPTALSRWLREPDTMKQEVGRTHSDVFQEEPANFDEKRPNLEVTDSTRHLAPDTVLRWRSVQTTSPVDKDMPLIELNGEIGFQKDYCANPENLWADLSSPLPFVFFHPVLPLYIDTRKEGSLARYVRRSCKPNAQLDTYLSGGSEYHFWLVSDRPIAANEQITLPWDFRLERSVCRRWLHLLGLSDEDTVAQDEPDLDDSEYIAISNWIDRILSEYGGCACDLDNHCAFARFHRHYLYNKNQSHRAKKKSRKLRTQTISPTSTGHATNSRAPSEGHGDDVTNGDGKNDSTSLSKPPSRDRTPVQQGSFDQLGILTEPTDRDKRKVAMVEDSFRRMEQQQPPKKKKRTSDGTNSSNPSKSKSRSGSAAHQGDNGTSRSKSGSPASAQSPNLPTWNKASGSRPGSLAGRSRQQSAAPRPIYCDAAVQTEEVDGEWFSTPDKPAPKRRIISLSKRLLSNRHRCRAAPSDEQVVVPTPVTTVACGTDSMDLDPISTAYNPPVVDSGVGTSPTISQAASDTLMADANGTSLNGVATSTVKVKTPDLRVQMPPVPTFDNSGLSGQGLVTPLSASGSIVQSPFAAGGLHSPFGPPTVNGAGAHPSPVKKKLSLSDYTKSRMNKAAGKASGGVPPLKPSISSPDEIKGELAVENQGPDKHGDDALQSVADTTTSND